VRLLRRTSSGSAGRDLEWKARCQHISCPEADRRDTTLSGHLAPRPQTAGPDPCTSPAAIFGAAGSGRLKARFVGGLAPIQSLHRGLSRPDARHSGSYGGRSRRSGFL